jgi:hypothetical protein
MNLKQFRDSLARKEPPPQLSAAQSGLWWDAKGDWTRAHESAQRDEGPDGAWVHAYLHRKEGDSSNAAYWYKRAAKIPAQGSFEDEWNQIAVALIGGARAS